MLGRPHETGLAITTGNAVADANRGWFVGQFVSESGGLRRRNDFEVKWGIHPKGERKVGEWALNEVSTSISILIEGEFLLWFKVGGEVREVRLKDRGDYVIWDPGVAHSWQAPIDCIILTMRCPSVERDQLASGDSLQSLHLPGPERVE